MQVRKRNIYITTNFSDTCMWTNTLFIYSWLTLSDMEVFLAQFLIIMFCGTLVRQSIGCMRQESEIKRQREGGCKHRGNWIMPLVGGNELSFFSISFTICFYLVINESSVWWQQAAGCLLAAAFGSNTQPVKPHHVSFTHTCGCNQPYTTQHMHTTTYS